jgi:DNA polymerase III gamma/tau subunit
MQGLALIAESSNGGLRDATQMLQKAVTGKYFTLKELQDHVGIMDESTTADIVQSLLTGDGIAIFNKIEELDHYDFIQLTGAIVSNAYAYRASGYIKNSYFEAKTSAIANHPNFIELAKTFEVILSNTKPFIRKSEVIMHLSKFLDSTKKIQEIKIRTRG